MKVEMKISSSFGWLFAICILGLSGCSPLDWEKNRSNTFVSNYGSVEFAFPPKWTKRTEENPFDLQCFSPQQDMNCGVFVYLEDDLSEATTPEQVLKRHVDDIQSKRTDFRELEPARSVTFENRTITIIPCSGKKDNEEYSYVFARVDFKDNPGVFAILLHVALPELSSRAKENILRIARSAKPVAEAPVSP